MDMDGYYCQIAVDFTPLQLVGEDGMEECDAIGGHCAGLEKLVWIVCCIPVVNCDGGWMGNG